MPFRFIKFIVRDDLRNNPNGLYLFGDNDLRVGLGGQAGQMRGEPNAIGVRTKHTPGRNPVDFFRDDEFNENSMWIDEDLAPAREALKAGRLVTCPSDGLGTGLSELPTRAPNTYAYLALSLNLLQNGIYLTPVEFLGELRRMKALRD